MCPIPQPPNTPSQAAACLCPLRTSLTLVPLSVSLLLTVHVTVSAVTDQGLKGNLGEKVSAGRRPACAKLRLSHCGWLCWCGCGGETTWIHCTKRTGIVIYIRKASGFILRGLGGHIRKTFPTMLGLPVFILGALWSFKTPHSRQRDVWNGAGYEILPLRDTSKTIQVLCSH